MMKTRIARLSPHQNAKTMAILMAITSLIFLVPVFLLTMMVPGEQRFPFWAIFVAPVFYLIFTYIFTVIGCAIYNVLVPITGGFEYDGGAPT